MALGANSGDVFKLVIKHGMTLTLIAVGLGLALSFALTRLLSGWLGWLYQVKPTDPVTFIGVPLLLSAVALWPVTYRQGALQNSPRWKRSAHE